ncbi:Aminopeptidase Y (Arg, Lys, Leu preference) [Alloactinosynnema sp. L-07]|uniref:M20/M25/M40 family metallo-hydrolase n=1 Tax=Alloactinosynnema sp. L-07 TaxID=1653480 RepID=UPI00065F0A2B|nr:M20/M25/M40 family metallo-hydrolase [Alloactinosynnema sp. L-07]CRK55046.1 Aminopeptidase Y (Arg, Lys, Leu preference) [Alloactinosynnema sp. L-07]
MRTRTKLVAGVSAVLVALSTAIGVANSAPVATAPSNVMAAPDIPVENVMAHLNQLQTIATNNGGNRAHGRPGFRASADYVKAKLDAAGFTTTLQQFTHNSAAGWNVIAEWPHGDANNVIMAGAHLDSVPAGPGLNDNGSGTAAVLEVALAVSRAGLRPQKRLRFGWWGAEELGLIGSKYYADNLGATERGKINAYLNFDMVGQKDVTTWGVYNHDTAIANTFKEYFQAKGIPTTPISWNGSSDHSSFTRHNIKVGGVGSSSDPCYHAACDTISNVGSRVMGHTTNAIAHTVWKLAGVSDDPTGDYAVALTPASGSVAQGGSVTVAVSTQTTQGTPQQLTLSATGMPAGTTATFAPPSVQSGQSSTLTITTSASTPVATAPITVVATGNNGPRQASYSLTVTGVQPGGCAGTNPTDFSIPDNGGVESPIAISGCAITPTTATVAVDIAHTYIGDLVVDLLAPDGTPYVLHNRTGGGTDNIVKTFTVNVTGETADGTWKLRARDQASQDVGRINEWRLTLAAGTTGKCASHQTVKTGTLATGANEYHAFEVAAGGTLTGCLDGPDGADYDLYLQKLSGTTWSNVASGTTSSADETLSYSATAGSYRYRVHAYSGAGAYSMGYSGP